MTLSRDHDGDIRLRACWFCRSSAASAWETPLCVATVERGQRRKQIAALSNVRSTVLNCRQHPVLRISRPASHRFVPAMSHVHVEVVTGEQHTVTTAQRQAVEMETKCKISLRARKVQRHLRVEGSVFGVQLARRMMHELMFEGLDFNVFVWAAGEATGKAIASPKSRANKLQISESSYRVCQHCMVGRRLTTTSSKSAPAVSGTAALRSVPPPWRAAPPVMPPPPKRCTLPDSLSILG